MPLKTFEPKDPNDILNYTIDWSQWLGADTIVASTWVVQVVGISKVSDTNDTTTATVTLNGGVVGTVHPLLNHIITAAGLEKDMTVDIPIAQQ